MSAYRPLDAVDVVGTVALLATIILLGFVVARVRPLWFARLCSWALVVAGVVGSARLNTQEPAGFRMLAIIGALLHGMKAVVSVEVQTHGARPLSISRWLGFAALWPGMRPGPFARRAAASLPEVRQLFLGGSARLLTGLAMVVLARLAWVVTSSKLLATPPLLVGLSLIVHFGAFDVLAAAWRWQGVDCQRLFRSPLRSTNLREFWGRRWNLAFSEMTAIAIYQPLVRVAGRGPALAASFLGSGLLHELAISVPVRAGYGLPMAYFMLHGILMTVEARLAKANRPIDRVPWIGRVWTLTWLLAPLPILFHRPFLAGVVWPLIGLES
ncbi:MAG: wax synthase family protein [Isosphaerales bacterium]